MRPLSDLLSRPFSREAGVRSRQPAQAPPQRPASSARRTPRCPVAPGPEGCKPQGKTPAAPRACPGPPAAARGRPRVSRALPAAPLTQPGRATRSPKLRAPPEAQKGLETKRRGAVVVGMMLTEPQNGRGFLGARACWWNFPVAAE